MSFSFRYFAQEVYVVRDAAGGRRREWKVYMQVFPEHGIIEAGTDVVVGDEVHETTALLGRRKPARVVERVDWDRQARLNQGVITWVGPTRSRRAQEEVGMVLDLDRHGLMLIDWLYERMGDRSEMFDVEQFTELQDLPEGSARLVSQHLETRGLINAAYTMGGHVSAVITTEGIAFAHKVRAMRGDHAQRIRSLRQDLLNWLYGMERVSVAPLDWDEFIVSPANHYFGSKYDEGEVKTAVSDLAARGLIAGMEHDHSVAAWVKPRLTSDGRDCVIDYGGNVSDYLKRFSSGNSTNVTMNHVHGNTVIGNENVVNNQASGIDIAKLVDFANFVRQVLPTLGLPEDERTEIGRQADELSEVTTASEDDRNWLRRSLDAVMTGLTKALPGVVTSTAIAMGEEARKAISGG